jgi:hypothetical protein
MLKRMEAKSSRGLNPFATVFPGALLAEIEMLSHLKIGN